MIGDIISALGFLREISDANERKNMEAELYQSVKQLIIEFLDFAVQHKEAEGSKKNFKIIQYLQMIGGAAILPIEDTEDIVRLYASIYAVKSKYRLTDKQMNMIIAIIAQMTPKIIEDTYISFNEEDSAPLYFTIEKLFYGEKLNRHCSAFCNLHLLSERLEEIKNGNWDPFIKTSIKELG